MEEQFERDLENPETWDFENPEVKEPTKAPRVVFSVAFRREDFITVSEYAERMGKKTSEFIREAALEKATGRSPQIWIHYFNGTHPVWGGSYLPGITRVLATNIKNIKQPADEGVTTSA